MAIKPSRDAARQTGKPQAVLIALDEKRFSNMSKRLAAHMKDRHSLDLGHTAARTAMAKALNFDNPHALAAILKGTNAGPDTGNPVAGVSQSIQAGASIQGVVTGQDVRKAIVIAHQICDEYTTEGFYSRLDCGAFHHVLDLAVASEDPEILSEVHTALDEYPIGELLHSAGIDGIWFYEALAEMLRRGNRDAAQWIADKIKGAMEGFHGVTIAPTSALQVRWFRDRMSSVLDGGLVCTRDHAELSLALRNVQNIVEEDLGNFGISAENAKELNQRLFDNVDHYRRFVSEAGAELSRDYPEFSAVGLDLALNGLIEALK